MARTLTEQKVLKKLGIPDFRHMTKDKIVQFASVLPRMDPEVAKKHLNSFQSLQNRQQRLCRTIKMSYTKALTKTPRV